MHWAEHDCQYVRSRGVGTFLERRQTPVEDNRQHFPRVTLVLGRFLRAFVFFTRNEKWCECKAGAAVESERSAYPLRHCPGAFWTYRARFDRSKRCRGPAEIRRARRELGRAGRWYTERATTFLSGRRWAPHRNCTSTIILYNTVVRIYSKWLLTYIIYTRGVIKNKNTNIFPNKT